MPILACCLAVSSVAVGSIAALTAPGRATDVKIVAANTPTVPGEPSFSAVGSMNTGRYLHTATLLNNGKVLIAGGVGPVTGGFASLDSTELFDPATGAFTQVSSMTSARQGHAAITLPNGKILITGGTLNTVNGSVSYLNSAELFDPVTDTFTAVAPMNVARVYHTATLLQNGKVLIVGGDHIDSDGTNNTAELFDPATWTFTLIANTMNEARSFHTTTTLQNGKVLIAGGGHQEGPFEIGTDTAELFDPVSQTFTPAGVMSSVRYEHTATCLPNGKVLVAGGSLAGDVPVIGAVPTVTNVSHTADLFDPATGTFTQVAPSMMSSARTADTATLLPNGKVIIAGGYNGGVAGPGIGPASWPNTVDIFDPSSNTFSPATSTMTSGRSLHTATVLADGRVLLAGGFNGSAVLNTAELAESSSGSFTAAPAMIAARGFHTSTMLSNGKVLLAGGTNNTQITVGLAELFDSTLGTFTATGSLNSPREAHTATLLGNGKVLIAGGLAGSSLLDLAVTDGAELFDPDSGTFTVLPSMTTPRLEHSATLLPNGKVLFAGGEGKSTYLKTAELFDPQSGTFSALSNTMTIQRHGHSATLLPNGKVLIAGGDVGLASLPSNTAEIYDPLTQTFAALTSTMSSVRAYHTATLLPNGKVLLAAGFANGAQPNYYTDAADLFDPATNTFSALPKMNAARYGHTATLLASGKVLIAAGISNPNLGQGAVNTAEVFDPVLGTFNSLLPNTMTGARVSHTATLLPNGSILLCGGSNINGYVNTAEFFDAGLGFSDSRRPIITVATDPLLMPASLMLSGSGFRGDSEANGGAQQGSATNLPVVQLMRIDNDQVYFPLSDPATNWSDTTFFSETLGTTTTLLPKGSYRVTIFTNGIPSIQRVIEINGTTVPLVPVTSIVSRRAHGNVGVFDIPLPVTGPPGIECRSGGTNGDYTVIFSFANTLTSVGGVSVPSGVGSVNSSWMSSDMYQYVVNLTGVANAQVITVTLTNVSDSVGNFSSAISPAMAVLLGDTNGDGFVNSADIGQTKSQSGHPVNAMNFREDVNADGFVNSADISLVKSRSGTGLP